jgi:acylphosphatase
VSCRRFVVSGLVQGVFYRASAQQAALRLGLTGWVRNRTDGCVELVASGDDAKLDELEKWLWQGPPNARVENVTVEHTPPQAFQDFSIAR